MGRTHAVVVLAAIGLGAGLWLTLSSPQFETAPPLPPVDPRPQPSAPTERPSAAQAQRQAAGPQRDEAARAETVAAEKAEPATTSAPTAALSSNVRLNARSLASKEPIAQFRWRYLPQDEFGGVKGMGSAGRADLGLTRGGIGRLYVEAEGHEPYEQAITVPTLGQPDLLLDVFLSPAASAAGVLFEATSQSGAAIARLRIDLWQLPADAAALDTATDPSHEPLWKRAFEDGDGVHKLPDLPPGRYQLRAQPVDADGWALPLLPQRLGFVFLGHESVRLHAQFSPGMVLRIECPNDGMPPRLCDIETIGSGSPLPVRWHTRGETGNFAALDAAMLPGRAESVTALPELPYGLSVRMGEQALPATLRLGPAGWRVFGVDLRR
jgi:hypothetical protein